MSRHLADAGLRSSEWRTRDVRLGGRHNAFVGATLSEPVFLQRLAMPFEGAPFKPVGASVEKVLVGPAYQYSSVTRLSNAKVPFDAQVWLRLTPR